MVVKLLLLTAFVHLGLLLTTAGAGKMSRHGIRLLRARLADDHLLPRQLHAIIAVGLPSLELGTGIMLFVGFAPQVTASTAATLLCGFCVYRFAWRLANRGAEAKPCPCLGEVSADILTDSSVAQDVGVALNFALAVVSALLVRGHFVYSAAASELLTLSAVVSVATATMFKTIWKRKSWQQSSSPRTKDRHALG